MRTKTFLVFALAVLVGATFFGCKKKEEVAAPETAAKEGGDLKKEKFKEGGDLKKEKWAEGEGEGK